MRSAVWNARAAEAERAVLARYLGHVPGLAWGRSAWPAVARPRLLRAAGADRPTAGGGAPWHYWWQAHLIDAIEDAARHRRPSDTGRRVQALVRGAWLRNGGTLSRGFYDDIAWLGLALERAGDVHAGVAAGIAERLDAAIDPTVGAVPWRVGDRLFNAPANAPAAILLARTGRVGAAARLADWIDRELRDPQTGLIFDGIAVPRGDRADEGDARVVSDLYTYCQGVAVSAYAELAARTGEGRFVRRASALIDAIERWTAPTAVLPGRGGGDGGLFAGIAARHLALAAESLDAAAAPFAASTRTTAPAPTTTATTAESARSGRESPKKQPPSAETGTLGAAQRAAASARDLALRNAEAVWAGRDTSLGAPLFSADWRRPADAAPSAAERDLSVQLGAWLALEAAVRASGEPDPDR